MTKLLQPLLSIASLLALAHTTFAAINVQFDLEPGVEHVKEDGFCFEIKVPGNSLVSGAFTSESINEPIPGQVTPRILANVHTMHNYLYSSLCTCSYLQIFFVFRSLMKRETLHLVDPIYKVKLVSVSVPPMSPRIIVFVSVLLLVKVFICND